MEVIWCGAFQASGVPASSDGRHKVARLPVGKIDRREKAKNLDVGAFHDVWQL